MPVIEPLTGPELNAKLLSAAGPVAIDFHQESCPPCRVLEPHPKLVAQRYKGRLPVYRVDVDHDLAAAERFGVTSIPTILISREATKWSASTAPSQKNDSGPSSSGFWKHRSCSGWCQWQRSK